jgi:hypothetical protein
MRWSFIRVFSLVVLASVVKAAMPDAQLIPENFDLRDGRLLSERSASLQMDVQGFASDQTGFHIAFGESWSLSNQDGDVCLVSERCPVQEREDRPMMPRYTHFFEVPEQGDVHLVIDRLLTEPIDMPSLSLGAPEETGLRQELDLKGSDAASAFAASGFDHPALIASPVIFRDLRMVSLSVHPFFLEDGQLQQIREIDLHLEYGDRETGSTEPSLMVVGGNEKSLSSAAWSSTMDKTYAGMCLNHGQFYNDVDDTIFPVYLITGSPDYLSNPAYMAEFVKWKREKGFDVRIVPFDEIPGGGQSIAFGSLRDWVAGQWDELRPEYLLLVGDDDGDAACPDSVVQSSHGEFDVSDHFFGLLEGDDYFPDLFVGRFSVDSPQQLFVMAQKPVIHEKMPNIAGTGWLDHGLVVSCNYSDTGNHPISPNLTSRWVIDKLRANGFAIGASDSLFYPPLADGGALISSALNAGRGIVNYRGWANSNGWIYPAFDRDDIWALNNVMKMPIVASFVCQTGAYGAGSGDVTVEDPCFGEAFVRVGDPGAPKGAVAFVGPSDLHTRSQYNNPVCSGFFNAIFDLDLSSIGPALLNGKMELHRGYPLEHEDPFGTYFYFHVYNVLGDPDLQIWRDDPGTLAVAVDTQLAPGTASLEVYVNDSDSGDPVNSAFATLTAGSDRSTLLARGRVENGSLLLSFDPELALEAGSMVLTVSSLNHTPSQQTLTIGSDGLPTLLGWEILDETADGLYLPGELLQLKARLQDVSGTGVAAGELTLRDPLDWPQLPLSYEVVDAALTYDALGADATITTSDFFEIRLSETLSDAETLPLAMDAQSGAIEGLLLGSLQMHGLAISLDALSLASGADQLFPLQNDELNVTVVNTGSIDFESPQFQLISGTDLVQVLSDPVEPGAFAIGESRELSFSLRGGSSLFTGMLLNVDLQLIDDGLQAALSLTLPSADRLADDPRGPDAHGYWAIESDDYGVQSRPEYDWVELDPVYGGQGAERLYLIDDDVTTIDAPFPVKFYGEDQTQISICSNGWISFGETWMSNFRNWNIPSALGPSNMVCAFWDDLKPRHMPAGQDSLYVPVFLRHDVAEGRLVIEWSRTFNRYAWENEGQPMEEFQIVIYDQATRPTSSGDNEILVQFKQVTDLDQNNNFATCGIQNFGHNIGLEVSYAALPDAGCSPLGGGRSVLFTTATPLNDTEYRVEVVQPLPQSWMNSIQPILQWNHELFAADIASDDIDYSLALYDAEGTTLLSAGVNNTGEFDLAATEVVLPENEQLRFTLSAASDGATFDALQGEILFYVDATPPVLTPALLSNSLFIGTLELGLISSEPLAVLSAVATNEAGETLSTFEMLSGTQWDDGRQLNYLTADATSDLFSVVIFAEDLHGLANEDTVPIALSTSASGGFERGDLRFEWTPQAGSWFAVMGLPGLSTDALIPGLGSHAFQLVLPAGLSDVQLQMTLEADKILVQLTPEGAVAVSQTRLGDQVSAHLTQSGQYAIRQGSSDLLPAAFKLVGCAPNPFNPSTWLHFDLPSAGDVHVVIYNLQGQQVTRMSADALSAGSHRMLWDGRNTVGTDVASGLYIATLQWQNQVQSTRMLLLR